jgi:beta-lactamase superfamily II metal-dependent hydrolase
MEDEVCALLTQRQTDYYTSLQNGTIVIEGDGNGNYKISKEK